MDTSKYRGKAEELLRGSYDIHVHTSPSHFQRLMDDFELVHCMDKFGMAGALIKTHYGATSARAEIANRHSGGKAKLFGGVVLDGPVGGLNPAAVESEIKLGGKMVWLPTFHAKNHMEFPGVKHDDPVPYQPISILNENGTLCEKARQVLDMVKRYDVPIGTGHVSVEESMVFCREARAVGVTTIFTHSEFKRTVLPIDKQVELTKLGVFMERCIRAIDTGGATMDAMVDGIRASGVENSFLTTDYGQKVSPSVPEGMTHFIEVLLGYGFTEKEINIMVKENPKKLLKI